VKRKHYGILSVVLILLALTATVLYAINASYKIADEIRISRIKPFPSISVPDSSTIKEIEGLEERIVALGQPRRENISPVDLRLFGYQPMERPKFTKRGRKVILPTRMNYSLTLAFSSGKKRFCVIDGAFYPEGSSLPDGGRIVRIEPNRVLVSKHRLEEWMPVRERIREIKKEKKVSRKAKAP